MNTLSNISFPVIRGVQAGREYYVAMWTLRMMQRISIFNEEDLPPELRAQRILNKARIPEISGYILDNPDDYVFSALTVSVDSEVEFEPVPGQDKLGMLKVPMEAKFIINDGQHRRAAIKEAWNSARNSAMKPLPSFSSSTSVLIVASRCSPTSTVTPSAPVAPSGCSTITEMSRRNSRNS